MSEAPRPVIGRYQVLEPIGAGAMGTVYLARDPVLNRKVAIKVMADSVARDPELRSRFLREAQSAGSLQHPNIVTIYDFGDVDDDVFIAMEYVEGTDLSELLQRDEPLPMHRKLEIMIDLLKGLAHAHRHGIVHRDVKPGNIRITPDGTAKLMDFGLVHMAATRLTSTGALLGTPHYMAPEQITLSGALSPASDVFSAGGVLYELLTGNPAFNGDTVHRVMYRIVSEPHIPLATAAPDAPPALEKVLQKSLAKNPAERYRDASEMLAALTPIAAVAAGTPKTHTTLEHAVSESLRLSKSSLPPLPAPASASAAGRQRLMPWLLAGGAAVLSIVLVVMQLQTTAGTTAAPSAEDATAPRLSLAADTTPAPPPAAAAVPPPVVSGNPKAAADTSARIQRPEASRQKASGAAAVVRQAPESTAASRTAVNEIPRVIAESTAAAAARAVRTDPPPTPPPLAATNTGLPVSKAPAIEAPRALTRDEVEALVRAYAQAIESRNTGAVRQLYPAIRADQVDGFQRFFNSVRTLQVRLSIEPSQIGAGSATGRISGTYEFTDAQGQQHRQPVSFQATFRRVGERLVIESVR